MKTIRWFEPVAERYYFDFKKCLASDGWAQVDTRQDAPWFGTWTNPFTLVILSFTEGDVAETRCENESEYLEELKRIRDWNLEDNLWQGIDPMENVKIRDRLEKVGAADLMHQDKKEREAA